MGNIRDIEVCTEEGDVGEYKCQSIVGIRNIRNMYQHNVAAARAVDREFNYNFGSDLGLLGSGRGSNGRGAPVGSM